MFQSLKEMTNKKLDHIEEKKQNIKEKKYDEDKKKYLKK